MSMPAMPVLWSQGLFLTPQHLQQQDRAFAQAVQAIWREAVAYGWGIGTLRLNQESLGLGEVNIERVTAVTPAGLLISAGTLEMATHDTARLWRTRLDARPADGAVDLHLCVAHRVPGQPVLMSLGEAGQHGFEASTPLGRRFIVLRGELPDALDPLQEAQDVGQLALLAQVVATPAGADAPSGVMAGFDSLRVARLKPDGARFAVDHDFIPPILTLGGNAHLRSLLLDAAGRMGRRAAELRPQYGTPPLRADVSLPENLTAFILLRSLNTHTISLRQATEFAGRETAPRTSPAQAYNLLRQAIADLSAFDPMAGADGSTLGKGEEPALPPLPAYNHDDCGPGFVRAIARLNALVDGLGTGPLESIELVFEQPESWAKDGIPPAFFEGITTRFYLAVDVRMPASDLERSLGDRKIGPRVEIEQMKKLSLRGMRLSLERDTPRGLPQMQDRIYFEIDREDKYWKQIVNARSFVLVCPELVRREIHFRIYRRGSTV